VAEASLCGGMIDVVLLVENGRRARKLLVEVCFVDFSMVYNGNHVRVIETQMIWPTSHNRAFGTKR
jgi:hypothetical protein